MYLDVYASTFYYEIPGYGRTFIRRRKRSPRVSIETPSIFQNSLIRKKLISGLPCSNYSPEGETLLEAVVVELFAVGL
jgi:hypothetical protein